MRVFDRYQDALRAHVIEHGHYPYRVYVSPSTADRMVREAHIPQLPPLGTLPAGVVGYVGGCEWYEDATMGDGFRFEGTVPRAGA